MEEVLFPNSQPSSIHLMQAALKVVSSLDLKSVLREFVEHACSLTNASYGALSVLDNRGNTSMFIMSSDGTKAALATATPPQNHADIAAIALLDGVIINDLTDDYRFNSFRTSYPQVNNFLGVPVRLHEQIYGQLHLCGTPDGFTAEHLQVIKALAAVTAVAIENSKLYADARNRERWIRVSQQLTTTLLEGTDEEEALELITRSVRNVADADTAIIVLPSVKDVWAAEIVDGTDAEKLIGIRFPPQGRAMTVLREGQGLIVDSMERAATMRVPELAAFGPALYAPLISRRKSAGVLILLRRPGRSEFEASELTLAESVASQAALALELASARHAEDMANLLEERERIGRDLHDLAIQQLFATGMQLDSAKNSINPESEYSEQVLEALEKALHAVDDSVRQIRTIVHNLREPDENVPVVERLRRETSLARNALGFAPSYVLEIDDVFVGNLESSEHSGDALMQIEDRISADLADDVVAVVREGLSNVARHAHASSVSVTVSVNGSCPDGKVKITVSDDGQGLNPDNHRRSGLDNLTSRARRHNGSFWIGMNPSGRGTTLEWEARLI